MIEKRNFELKKAHHLVGYLLSKYKLSTYVMFQPITNKARWEHYTRST